MKHILLFAAGAAAAGFVAGLANNGVLHKAAATATSYAMAANDAVTAETQAIMDDAADMRAEARFGKTPQMAGQKGSLPKWSLR